jgi:transposase
LNNNKYTEENIQLRRDRVAELDSQGYSQRDISTKLGISLGLVNSDLQYIKAQAREHIRSYINEKLPEEYNRCLSGLNSILKQSWDISANTADTSDKIRALQLAKEVYNSRLDLLTNVTVIEDVIKFVNKNKSSMNVVGCKWNIDKPSEEPEHPVIEEDTPTQVTEEE